MKTRVKIIHHSKSGFAILGVFVAIVILGSMAAGIAMLVSANQKSRVATIYTGQAFYVTHSAFEATLRQSRVNKSLVLPVQQFMGSNFDLVRANQKVYSQATYGNAPMFASNAFSICDSGTGSVCFYVLAGSGSGTLSLNGTADLVSNACGIHVNSSSTTAVQTNGNAIISTSGLAVVGGISNPGAITVCGQIQTSAAPAQDPLLGYDIPAYGNDCDHINFSVNSTATLNPGVYCGGIDIKGSGTVTLNPGNYILDGGVFKLGGSATLVGNDVTIFLTSKLRSGYATLDMAGGGSVTLNAPTSGTYAGILIFQSRNAPTNGSNSINGGGNLNLNGAVYLPNQSLSFSGGNSTSAPCTMFVVGQLSLTGSTNVGCPAGALAGLMP